MSVRIQGPGHVAFALGTAGLGALCLVYGDLAPQWHPVPAWMPWPHAFAYASGIVLLACAAGLWIERVAARAAMVLTAYLLFWVVLRVKDVAVDAGNIARWNALGEATGYMIGALLLCGVRRAMRAAQIGFGACCVGFGLAHYKYADFTVGMVPSWLPTRSALVYVTGTGHLAAGLSIVTGVFDRLGATLEAIMLGVFVVVVHVPSLVVSPAPRWAPTAQIQLTELCVALVLAGAAGLVARSLRER